MHNLKTPRTRDKNHRKFVASLPCIACRIAGYSQAAHIGKGGIGLKSTDEWVLPLCCARPDIEGCHITSAKNEKKFYERFGGIDHAKQTAQQLYAVTGNWYKACEIIVKFGRVK